jgi:hypothetical protein
MEKHKRHLRNAFILNAGAENKMVAVQRVFGTARRHLRSEKDELLIFGTEIAVHVYYFRFTL